MMKNLTTILMDLLCYLSVEPDNGYDPDETADLQINAWQTLIHDLTEEEAALIKDAARSKLASMAGIQNPTPEQEQVMDILSAFVDGELQLRALVAGLRCHPSHKKAETLRVKWPNKCLAMAGVGTQRHIVENGGMDTCNVAEFGA